MGTSQDSLHLSDFLHAVAEFAPATYIIITEYQYSL